MYRCISDRNQHILVQNGSKYLPEYVLATFSDIFFLAVSANKLNVRNCNSRFSGTDIPEEKKVINLLLLQLFMIAFNLALLNFQTTYQMKTHSKKKSVSHLIELASKSVSDRNIYCSWNVNM